VVDVKIRRADLPEANSQAIYERMQTERQQEATQIRALGEQQARRIRAEADREAVVIVAEAQKESEQVRGRGEADRNSILAAAFNADPEFFAFYRSMQAYQLGLGGTDTRWVISPDSEFFRFFNDSDALAAPPQVRPEPPVPAPATDSAPDQAAEPDAAMTAPDTAPATAPAEPPPAAAPATAGGDVVPAPAPGDAEAATGDPITIE
jgi:membrane protease subunit HflC